MVRKEAYQRYNNAILALEYDQRNNALEKGEAEWYADHLNPGNHRVLELACGSGRITIPLSTQNNRFIDAVDISQDMLSLLEKRIKKNAITTINPIQGDMLDFYSAETYSDVILGYNSIRYAETSDNYTKLIKHIYNNLLEQNGVFLFNVSNLDRSKYPPDYRRVIDLSDNPIEIPEYQARVKSKFEYSVCDEGTRIKTRRTYIIDQAEQESIIEFDTFYPILDLEDYLHILSGIGFIVMAYDGYSNKVASIVSKNLCFVCRKAAEGV